MLKQVIGPRSTYLAFALSIEHSKVYSARVSGVCKKKYKLFLGFQILCRTLSVLLNFGEEPRASCRESIR